VQPDGVYVGKQAIRAALEFGRSFWPDGRFTVLEHFEEDRYGGADEFSLVGTFTAPLVLPDGTQLPPCGKQLTVKGMQVVLLRDGKIATQRIYCGGPPRHVREFARCARRRSWRPCRRT